MHRARRLASIALATAVGVTALSACRSDPDVAAYVGGKRITEHQITDLVKEAGNGTAAGAEAKAPARSDVVRTVVFAEVCERLSAEKGYRPQHEVPAEAIAQEFNVPPTSRYARDLARLYTCWSGVPGESPVAPTAEEMADVVARGKAGGAIPSEVPVQEAAAQLDGEQLRATLAKRKSFIDAIERYDVTVNPRYRPLDFPGLTFQGDVPVPAVVVPIAPDPGMIVAPN